MSAKEALAEILPFLAPTARPDLKIVALQHVLGLTANKEGIEVAKSEPRLFRFLLEIAKDGKTSEALAKDGAMALINLSADPEVALMLLKDEDLHLVRDLWGLIVDKDSAVADPACMTLSNLTKEKVSCDLVLGALEASGITMERLVFVFCQEGYNAKGAKLHYLGPFLSNLSQLGRVRDAVLDRDGCVIQRLLPYTEYKASKVRRGGIVGTLRNCCFNPDHHEWLLSDEVDLLPRLLLPLAGPTPDDLDPEDVERLPLDLQYLDEDKEVEADADLRKMLLEAITQLCATKKGRETIRGKSTYFILKQLHKEEKDKTVRLACENVVDILIKKEEEINLESYHDVEVPSDVVPELEKMDKEYLEDAN